MVKYNEDFKLKVVKDYLGGTLGFVSLAKKHRISSTSLISAWVHAFKEFGEDGIYKRQPRQVYPVQFKIDVLNFMEKTGASYQDTAIVFKMSSPSLIANWYALYSKKGRKGLGEEQKGRSLMAEHRKRKPLPSKNDITREERLERENELLRLENSYLKKVKAFQESSNASPEKHRRPSRSNSKKKDSK